MDGTPGIGTIGTAADLGRADRLIWGLIAAVAALVLTSAAAFGFSLVWHSFLAPGITVVVLLAGQWLYQTRRPDLRLAGALGATAQIMAFSAVGAPLSYLAASFNFPLTDQWLEVADRALGFDWFALFAWLKTQATASFLLRLVYLSLMPQTLLVVLALAVAGRIAELRIFVLAFIAAAVATIALSAPWPAEGVWLAHGLKADGAIQLPASATSWPIFHGLRDGSYRLLVATGAEGIITFPSLHSALAVLLAAALWPVPVLRWIAVALNAVMLVSIPVDGGHYFIDIFAGVAIACLSLYAARRLIAGPTPHLADANIANPANSIAQIAVRSR
jgi:membrane-associated phospholipid phosphatase